MDIAFSMGAHAAFGINMWKLYMQQAAEELEKKRLVFYLTINQGMMRPWKRHASQLGQAKRLMAGIQHRQLGNAYHMWLDDASRRAQAAGLSSYALTWRAQRAGDAVFIAFRSEHQYRKANTVATEWIVNGGRRKLLVHWHAISLVSRTVLTSHKSQSQAEGSFYKGGLLVHAVRHVWASFVHKEQWDAVQDWKHRLQRERNKVRAQRMIKRVAGRIRFKEQSDAVEEWKGQWTVARNKAKAERMMRRVGGRLLLREPISYSVLPYMDI